LVALSSGRRVDRLLAEHLGSVNIEDLPLGFFCVSASLTRAEEVKHERASLSLPGFLPPVYAAGDLLVDGAALNNLPVDVMRDRLGSGCVVAVDLSQMWNLLKPFPSSMACRLTSAEDLPQSIIHSARRDRFRMW
jgi:predicted acylesterase/phospholipase RssA